MALNLEVRDRWVAALRSRDYNQGRSKLRTSNGRYCCLGVLCRLAVDEKIVPVDVINWDGSYPPAEVAAWLGVPAVRSDARVREDGELFPRAAYWNDTRGFGFHEIANRLEQEL